MGGGGWRGSMRTTLLSTLGGGLKLFLPTLSRWDTLAAAAAAAVGENSRSTKNQQTLKAQIVHE
jgi:hypothetical protein